MIPGKVPPSIIVLQPTTFCNINCSYCYLPSRHLRNKIIPTTLARLIHLLTNSAPNTPQKLLLSWHGGEPLAVGAAFYSDAFGESSILEKHNYIVTHAVQTNGMLLSDEFAELFRANAVSLCVSIDGPERFHDRNRRYRNGMGTFRDVMAGIQVLNRWSIEYTVISVISEDHFKYTAAYFSFMASLGVKYLALNMPEIEGLNKTTFLSRYSDYDISSFWRNVLVLAVKHKIRVRELDYCMLRFAMPISRHETTIPFRFLNVAYDGQYSTFDPELMGQLMLDGSKFFLGRLECDISNHWQTFEASRAFIDIQNGVNKCEATCGYFSFCGGGPVGNKLFENGTFNSTETLACRYRIKRLVDMLIMLSETDDEIVDQYVNMLLANSPTSDDLSPTLDSRFRVSGRSFDVPPPHEGKLE